MGYNIVPKSDVIRNTMEALEERGFEVELVETKEEALSRIQQLIPAGADVMTGGSTTLTQIGLDDLFISKKHPWNNLKDAILSENDPVKQNKLRKLSTMADYYLGSFHAAAETGELVIASATGSQLPAYVFSSSHIIFVAGTHKITDSLESAIRRVREYVYPLEDRRMKRVYGENSGSMIGKLLIFERENPILGRKIHIIFVNEVLGF